ncbi:MAG: ABC transporter permease [Solirubrobacteraceae bacterium]
MGPRGSLTTALRAFGTRDFLVGRSYRLAFVLELGLMIVDLAVYYFISRTFTGATRATLGAAPTYFAFASVGIALTVVVNSTSAGLANRMRQEQLTGTLEAVAAEPVSAGQLAFGMSGLPFLASLARAGVYLLIATLLLGVDASRASWPGFVAVLALSGMALASIGIASAAATLIVKRAEFVAGFLTYGMGLIGGAFFPVSVLPAWLRPLGRVVPTRFAYDGLRSALFKGHGFGGDLAALGLFAIVLLPVSVLVFSAALRAARRSGSLAAY